jgi:hypothetical protein
VAARRLVSSGLVDRVATQQVGKSSEDNDYSCLNNCSLGGSKSSSDKGSIITDHSTISVNNMKDGQVDVFISLDLVLYHHAVSSFVQYLG